MHKVGCLLMKKWFNMLSKFCTLKVYPGGRVGEERGEMKERGGEGGGEGGGRRG